jgi:hypothetical protein
VPKHRSSLSPFTIITKEEMKNHPEAIWGCLDLGPIATERFGTGSGGQMTKSDSQGACCAYFKRDTEKNPG